jgi:hypothetical protein
MGASVAVGTDVEVGAEVGMRVAVACSEEVGIGLATACGAQAVNRSVTSNSRYLHFIITFFVNMMVSLS